MQTTLQQTLQAAYQAFASNRHAEAHRHLDRLETMVGDQPDAVHLRALILKAEGHAAQSGQKFAAADRLRPRDPQILTNWGNLLSDTGDQTAALERYDKAIQASPTFTEARYNRALALHRLGLLEQALVAFDALAGAMAQQAKLHGARGAVLMALERPLEAIDAFDRALALDPMHKVALAGRARLALETGEAAPVGRYIAALQLSPGDRTLILGVVQAMLAEGDATGLDILQDVLRQDPAWIEGHYELALLRAEIGAGDDFASHIRDAIKALPHNPALHQLLATVLGSAEHYAPALAALQEGERLCGPQPDWAFEMARLEGETGNWASAWSRLHSLPDSDLSREVRGRLALRMGRADEAAIVLQGLVDRSPGSVSGWAYLSLAWRLTNDPRHAWLVDQPGLWAATDLDHDEGQLERLADLLRAVHRGRANPIGQSLRGGTQTRGRLFWRTEPELLALNAEIERALAHYMARLPAQDDGHPLLRHATSTLTIAGSWSVRLMDQGFHVSHIHPQGVLSSACYIVVPQQENADPHAGWLEIGGAPAELQLGLEPLARIQPKPGRLALFPSYLFHGTRPFQQGERISVAFDATA